MPFEFIDNNAPIDRAARKRIRTRAAAGKNANRTLTRLPKTTALNSNTAVPFLAPTSLRRSRSPRNGSINDNELHIEIHTPIGDGLRLPVSVPVKSRSLVREALFFFCGVRHIKELDRALENPDVTTTIWVQYFFVDEAYFHCSLAISILCAKNLVHETAQGMYHIARTYRIVQERLKGGQATADMTIAILVIMSQYERIQGQYERGYIHMQGLHRMVGLRGGIKQLSRECWGVIQKVLRADLEYALQLGPRPMFGPDAIEVLRSWGSLRFDGVGEGERNEVNNFLQARLRSDIWVLYDDMRRAARLLNEADAGYREKVNAVEFHNVLLLFGHRLLQISPLDASSDPDTNLGKSMSTLDKAVHLALVAFLVTFLTGLDHRIPEKPLLSSGLRLATQDLALSLDLEKENWAVQSVLIWMLFIGSVVEFKFSDDEWLIPTTHSTMQALGLISWGDVRGLLAGFPWVNAVHDRAGISLSSTQKALDFEFSIQPDHFL
ncbi:hypothetical protein BJX70DRAFT_396426 [Aspergillus crustosus]